MCSLLPHSSLQIFARCLASCCRPVVCSPLLSMSNRIAIMILNDLKRLKLGRLIYRLYTCRLSALAEPSGLRERERERLYACHVSVSLYIYILHFNTLHIVNTLDITTLHIDTDSTHMSRVLSVSSWLRYQVLHLLQQLCDPKQPRCDGPSAEQSGREQRRLDQHPRDQRRGNA